MAKARPTAVPQEPIQGQTVKPSNSVPRQRSPAISAGCVRVPARRDRDRRGRPPAAVARKDDGGG